MKIYSADLRQRVVAAVQAGNQSQGAIAKTFGVSLGTVENWWRTFRASGRTAPLPHAGGKKRVLQPYAKQIRRAVKHQPDATLDELGAAVAAQTGVQANRSMLCRELQRLGLPRKKVAPRRATRPATHPSPAPHVSGARPSPPAPRRRPA
jgi:putative transposase